MTIFYNPAYISKPYTDSDRGAVFAADYCGDIQLLQRLLFYAGIPYLPVTREQRIAHYHTNMLSKMTASSPFYGSFKTDSAGMSRAVLTWRDALVGVGWNVSAYEGSSVKLSLIRDFEPEDMPRGEADYWKILIGKAEECRVLPEEINIVVTCRQSEIKPHIAHILLCQQQFGVKVEYCPIEQAVADGNLGKIQTAILSGSVDKISLDGGDDTFTYLKFATEDDALRYVATEPVDSSVVYYCSHPKRLDNTLKLLGKPTIGSKLNVGCQQVAQLFLLGNGLFEYPLNIGRIVQWLNMPISPIDIGLRSVLSCALVESGGINNQMWNSGKENYLAAIEDDKRRQRVAEQYEEFLPMPVDGKVSVERVRSFNQSMRRWATMLLGADNSEYDNVVKEQISAIQSYCTSLLTMLDGVDDQIEFLDLQMWCNNIVQPGSYSQYQAELGSHTTISSIGNLHDVAQGVVWISAVDEGVSSYPFDMLNDDEYCQVQSSGAMIYSRSSHSLISQSAMFRILNNTKRLTIIEAEKVGGSTVARHPLVLQLKERIVGGLSSIAQRPKIADKHLVTDVKVVNKNQSDIFVQLDSDIELKQRWERYEDEQKAQESYSSVSQLITHPYNYVCERSAYISDYTIPSAENLNTTLGNVAHLIIEIVFTDRGVKQAIEYYQNNYDAIFEQAVDQKGLLLRQPENAINLRQLKRKMKRALEQLSKLIKHNALTVDKCEHIFDPVSWEEAGPGVTIGARTDMLLSDKSGGKVIFDFKYSTYSRKSEIEENRALQLELYRYVAKKTFGQRTPVRVAYILLPDVTVYTADDFEEVEPIAIKKDRAGCNTIVEAANSYSFRWSQLKRGVVERVEGQPVGTGEYGASQIERGLFPLEGDSKKYSLYRFDRGHKNLK